MALSRNDALFPRHSCRNPAREGDLRMLKMRLATAAALAALSSSINGLAQTGEDPLTKPIIGSRTAEWLSPAPPQKIFGNSYLVGFGGLSVALIDTGAGLILIDGRCHRLHPPSSTMSGAWAFARATSNIFSAPNPISTMPAALRRWRATQARLSSPVRGARKGCWPVAMQPTIRNTAMAAPGQRSQRCRRSAATRACGWAI